MSYGLMMRPIIGRTFFLDSFSASCCFEATVLLIKTDILYSVVKCLYDFCQLFKLVDILYSINLR